MKWQRETLCLCHLKQTMNTTFPARTLSLDAETILPYRFEPDLSEEVDSEEVHATVDVVSTETMIASHRIGNTDW